MLLLVSEQYRSGIFKLSDGYLQVYKRPRRGMLPSSDYPFVSYHFVHDFGFYSNHIQNLSGTLSLVNWKATNILFSDAEGYVQFVKTSFRLGQFSFLFDHVVTHRVGMDSCTS